MKLAKILDLLEKAHGPPEAPTVTDPFEQVLLENVCPVNARCQFFERR